MRSWLALGLLLTACWSDRAAAPAAPAAPAPPPGAPPGATWSEATAAPPTSRIRFRASAVGRCRRVLAGVYERNKDDMMRDGLADAVYAEMLEVSVASCEEQIWSPSLLDCLEAATGNAAGHCLDELSAEQRKEFMDRLSEVVRRLLPPPAATLTPPTPPPSP